MKKTAYLVLILILAFTAFLGWRMSKVRFDYDFEKFFPADDPDTEFFMEYRKKFESDNDFVLIGLVHHRGVFQQDFLLRTDSLCRDLKKIPYVDAVHSLVSYKELVMPSFSNTPFEVPAVHLDQPDLLKEDSARIFRNGILVNNLISEDARSLAILVNTRQYLSKRGSDSLAMQLNQVMEKHPFDEVHIAGRSTGQSYYVSLMQKELAFFAFTSFLIVVLFLFVSFRSFWAIWVPVLVVVFTAIWIIGFMELVGEGINLVLTILPTIMFVVGMSDVVHIISKYVDELRDGKTKTEALYATYREVALATLLTSLTTAVGFLSLLTSSIEPVRDFGLYTALGVVFAFVLAYTLLPAVLVLRPVPKIAAIPKASTFWQKFLPRLFAFVLRKRNQILIAFGGITVLSLIAMSSIRVNNFLLEDLKDGNELKEHFRFFEKKFAGSRPFEMAVLVKEKKDALPVSAETLYELEKIETFLTEEYGVGSLFSVLGLVKSVNKSLHGGMLKHYRIPESQEELNKIFNLLQKPGRNMFSLYVADSGKTLRISGKSPDLGSIVYKQKNNAFDQFFISRIDTTAIGYKITGTATLIDKNNGQVARGLIWGLLLSFLVIAAIVGLLYFDWRMILISLVPNILPILMIAALMAMLGIDLKVSTSMIFTISFGIAVDDTIHFISKLRLELAKGKTLHYAVKRTYYTTGRAIFLTTLILSGGFLTLLFSDFLGTFYLGLLVSLTLILAVICDLLLLPVLILLFYKSKNTA